MKVFYKKVINCWFLEEGVEGKSAGWVGFGDWIGISNGDMNEVGVLDGFGVVLGRDKGSSHKC